MNLRALTHALSATINPETSATVLFSSGYTTQATGKRVPAYTQVAARAQVQALTENDILKVNALNVQKSTHTIYLMGKVDGLVRKDNKGGDLIQFNGDTWLTTAVLEQWPDWVKVAAVLQLDATSS